MRAVEYYRLAAETGYARAQYALGLSYVAGEGAEKNHEEAARWLRLAEGGGDPSVARLARRSLAILEKEVRNPGAFRMQGMKWLWRYWALLFQVLFGAGVVLAMGSFFLPIPKLLPKGLIIGSLVLYLGCRNFSRGTWGVPGLLFDRFMLYMTLLLVVVVVGSRMFSLEQYQFLLTITLLAMVAAVLWQIRSFRLQAGTPKEARWILLWGVYAIVCILTGLGWTWYRWLAR